MNHFYAITRYTFIASMLLLFGASTATAQRTFWNTYDNTLADVAYGATQTTDRRIVITGSEILGLDFPMSVVEFDSAGNQLNTYIFNITQDGVGERGHNIEGTWDNGVVINAAKSRNDGQNRYEWYMIKLDASFNTEWTDIAHFIRNFELPEHPILGLKVLPDSQYVFSGTSMRSSFARRYDKNGNYRYHKEYRSVVGFDFENTHVYDIFTMRNGNWILPGRNLDFDTTRAGGIWFLADGETGTRVKHKISYFGPNAGDSAILYSGAKAENSGYWLVGKKLSQLWLMKVDEDIEKVSDNLVNIDANVQEILYATAVQAKDCKTVILVTYRDNTNQVHTALRKIDDSGTVIWTEYFKDASLDVYSFDLKNTDEGGFLITGAQVNTIGLNSDYHIIKTDANGTLCDNFAGIMDVTIDTTNATQIPITFTADIIGGNGAISYNWDFGDGTQVTGATNSQVHTFTTPGTYKVFLETVDANGCTAHWSDSFHITPPHVVADFIFNISGLNVCFAETSLNGADSVVWDFGDGAFGFTDSAICHTYIDSGIYVVCLEAYNSYSSDTVCQNVMLTLDPVVADFCYISNGLNVAVYDQSLNVPLMWWWNFGDGFAPVGIPDTNHTYAMGGNYNMSLTVNNAVGTPSTLNAFITLDAAEPTPVDDFTNTTNGFTVDFTDASSSVPDMWIWDFGDGNTLESKPGGHAGGDPIAVADNNGGRTSGTYQNPSHNYGVRGNYNVCLDAGIKGPGGINNMDNLGCGDTCRTISVTQLPVAGFEYDNTNGLFVQFTDTSLFMNPSDGPGLKWEWDFENDGVFDVNFQNPGFVYDTVGVYTVCLKVTNVDGWDSTCTPINVNELPPVANFSYVDQGNLTVDFTDLTSNNPNMWSWDFGDGSPIDNNQHPSHSYTVAGNYNVCLTAANNTASDTYCMMINVFIQPPIANFGASSTAVCVGDLITFTDSSQYLINSYDWDFGAGASPATATGVGPHNVTYSTIGMKTVSLILSGPGGTGPDTAEIKTNYILVSNPPVTSAIAGDDTVCQNETGVAYSVMLNAGSSYSWQVPVGATITSGQGSDNIMVNWGTASSGNVTVTETQNGCTGSSVNLAVFVQNSPATSFILGDTVVCENTTGKVYSVVAGATNSNLVWTVTGSGVIQSGQGSNSITVDWGSTNGSVSVVETDTLGCSGVTQMINVRVSIPNTSNISGSNNACENTSENYNVTNTAGSTYNWSVTGGSITSGQNSNNITVLWGTPGAGVVNVVETNADGCVGSMKTSNVTINPSPSTSPITGVDTTCVNNSENYSVTPSAGSTYNWTVTGGTIVGPNNQNSITVNWTSAGSQTVEVTETNNSGCSGSMQSFMVLVSPVPTTSIINGSSVVCSTETTTYSVTNTAGSTYNWLVTGGAIQSGQGSNSIMVVWGPVGTGNVSVTETNAGLCQATPQVFGVTINDCTPTALFSYVVVNLLDVDFTDMSSNAATWQWDFGGTGTSIQQHPSYTFPMAGTFTVCLTVRNTLNQMDSACRNVTVIDQDPPEADFVCETDTTDPLLVHFTDFSTNNPTSWKWTFGDGGSSTFQNPDHKYSKFGVYIIALTASNSGGSNAKMKQITLNQNFVGVDPAEIDNYLTIYPNPTNADLFIDFKEANIQDAAVTMFELSGKAINVNGKVDGNKYHIDTRSLAGGMYLVKVETPDLVIMKSIVIAH